MGNCLPRFRRWQSTRHKATSSTSSASSTTSQLPPPVSSSTPVNRKAAASTSSTSTPSSHPPPRTDPNFDLLSLDLATRPSLPFDGLNFTNTFGPTTALPPSTSPPPRPPLARRRLRKPFATSLHPRGQQQRPSTPNPFEGLQPPPLTIAVTGDVWGGLGGGGGGVEGAMSVSGVSKNGVSFFPHYSINYGEGKEGEGEEGEESMGGGTGGEGEEEKSRLSSTEMDDDISIRYTTPTMASTHIVRPLPSPSSLSVPQPSIGSGINSSEHSIVHSNITAPSAYRAKSLGSTSVSSGFHFPPVFSPKGGSGGGAGADMYSDSDTNTTSSVSPQSGHPHVTAASPPSATSSLTTVAHAGQGGLRQLEGVVAAAGHARTSTGGSGVYHPPTTNIQSPPPPSTDHLMLNTNAVALASQLFDDSELLPSTSSTAAGPSAAERYGVHKQRSPRSAIQRNAPLLRAPSYSASTTNSPHSAGATNADALVAAPIALHRLSSQPQATDPLHSTGTSSSASSSTLHTPSHSLSLSRLPLTVPRSPIHTRGTSLGRRGRGEEDEEGEVVEGAEDEDSATTGGDSKSREESRVRSIGIVRT